MINNYYATGNVTMGKGFYSAEKNDIPEELDVGWPLLSTH